MKVPLAHFSLNAVCKFVFHLKWYICTILDLSFAGFVMFSPRGILSVVVVIIIIIIRCVYQTLLHSRGTCFDTQSQTRTPT
jgi:hypothetical protein